jgi:DNA polymerase-3 subunit epsilon
MIVRPHPDPAVLARALKWADRVRNTDLPVVILDTETTGFNNPEIVQISACNREGEPLINTLILPEHPERVLEKGRGGKCAADIHGLTPDKLIGAPSFPEVWETLGPLIDGAVLVIFNANYDYPIIQNLCKHHGLPEPTPHTVTCAMLMYADYCGEWDDYHGNFRWQKLPEGDHSALGDVLATLRIVEQMIPESVPSE